VERTRPYYERMRLSAIALALAIPLLAACGGSEDETAGEDTAAAQSVQVTATDFAFDPDEITVEAGRVTFELTNGGDAPHALEIEGNDVEESSDTIEGGGTTTLEVELGEGTYEIYCPVGDHRDRGMAGTLTVGPGGAEPGDENDDDSPGGAGGY
jgi:plastocyanin